jgi:putative alpha-1,2-mannosidase
LGISVVRFPFSLPSPTLALLTAYSFVPQDVASLITLLGGEDEFIKRLDFLHTSGLTDIGNEPSFLTVFLYHYAGRPALSTQRAHTYIPSFFNASTIGLPGNDDSGAMASFTAFCMLGLFPNPGQNVYLISPPFFESVSFKYPGASKAATIKNVGFDPSYKNVYIQNATLNGQPYARNWIGHELFAEGMVLELFLGEAESDWGTKDEDRPPSMSVGSTKM